MTGRTQAVSSCGQTSGWLPISQSIIGLQGSGIGPYLYLMYASDLQTLSPNNVTIKYADDTTLGYSSANTVQLTSNRNMITSVPGLSEIGLPSILIKQKKLFSIGLPQDILIFHLFCQTLNELCRPHYLDLISRPPFLLLYM